MLCRTVTMSEPHRSNTNLLSQIDHASQVHCRRTCRPEKTIQFTEMYKCYKTIRKTIEWKCTIQGAAVWKHCHVLVLSLVVGTYRGLFITSVHYLYSFLGIHLFKQKYSEGNPRMQRASDPWKQSLFFLFPEVPLPAPAWKNSASRPHSVSSEVYPHATSSEKLSRTTLSTNTSSSPLLHLPHLTWHAYLLPVYPTATQAPRR